MNMILTKENWNNDDYKNLVIYLNENSDLKYKEFSEKIIVDNTLIGIRTPILKSISKEIYKGNYKNFLEVSSPKTYEEKLHELLEDRTLENIEWCQSNRELDEEQTEVEVTFKYKTKTPVKN